MPTIHQFRVRRLYPVLFLVFLALVTLQVSKRLQLLWKHIEQVPGMDLISLFRQQPNIAEMSNPMLIKRNSTKINDIRIHYFNTQEWSRSDVFDKCPHNCTLTWGSDYKDAKFVIFFAPRLSRKLLAPYKPFGQTWIYYSKEAPINYGKLHESFRYKFNWTMAMRRDSDSVTWNGFFERKKKYDTSIDWEAKWKRKTKDTAWFVTHCSTQSKREVIVKKMSKFIDIDVYGTCGKYKCPRDNESVCFDFLKRDYKFYLSFENAMCQDYITEKSFNFYNFLLETIPVVRGYGPSQYKMYLPPGSYINTDDFDSAENLTNYMKKVSADIDLLRSYMKWRDYYRGYFSFPVEFCKICERAHKSGSYKRLYVDANEWDKGGNYRNMCPPPNDFSNSAERSAFSPPCLIFVYTLFIIEMIMMMMSCDTRTDVFCISIS